MATALRPRPYRSADRKPDAGRVAANLGWRQAANVDRRAHRVPRDGHARRRGRNSPCSRRATRASRLPSGATWRRGALGVTSRAAAAHSDRGNSGSGRCPCRLEAGVARQPTRASRSIAGLPWGRQGRRFGRRPVFRGFREHGPIRTHPRHVEPGSERGLDGSLDRPLSVGTLPIHGRRSRANGMTCARQAQSAQGNMTSAGAQRRWASFVWRKLTERRPPQPAHIGLLCHDWAVEDRQRFIKPLDPLHANTWRQLCCHRSLSHRE
jgi:hypothetical protein